MNTIGGIPRNEFLNVAEQVMARFENLKENPSPKETGGYLYVFDGNRQRPLLHVELGRCVATRTFAAFFGTQQLFKYYPDIARERGIDADIVEGCKIVQPENSKGSSSGRELYGALLGHPNDHGNEAVLIVIWMIFRWITLEDAQQMAAISKNMLWEPLMHACGDLFDRPIPPGPLSDCD